MSQDELEVKNIDFESSPMRTPTSPAGDTGAKQHVKKSPGNRHPAQISASALDQLMSSN